jgi:predicted RNase H-like nuclease (RuvC/YqgF family)
MSEFKISERLKTPSEDDMIFAENLQESLPMWASVLQILLEKTGEENCLHFTFKDGSSLEYLSKKGNSKIERLEKERDELKDENRQLKQKINALECKIAT